MFSNFSLADLITSTYRNNIDAFKSQLREAQVRFDRQVQMDMYNLVAGTGKSRVCDRRRVNDVLCLAMDAALQKLEAVDSAYW